jgi:outer membrane protein
MLARTALSAIMLAVISAAPSSAAVFTLQDALAAAYQNNPQLEAARAGLRATDEDVSQANAQWRPSINATGSYGVSQGSISGISGAFSSHPVIGQVAINQPVFSSGRIGARIGRAKADVEAGRGELAATEQAVLLASVQAYMEVVRDEAVLRLNQDNVRALQDRLAAVQTQFSAGMVTRTDVEQAQARLAQARSGATAASLQLAVSRAAFESTIGRPAETLVPAPEPAHLPLSKDAALAVAVDESPLIVQARGAARGADYGVAEAVSALLPQMSLSAQYQYLHDVAGTNIYALSGTQQNIAILGQLTIPIYQGGAEEAGVRRAEQLRAQSRYATLAAERKVRQELEAAWQSLASARARFETDRAEMQADLAVIGGVTEEQKGGERSVLDILNAQVELLGAQVAVETSRSEIVVAAYRLLAAMGRLRAAALGLAVPLYDPAEHYNKTADAWFGLGD